MLLSLLLLNDVCSAESSNVVDILQEEYDLVDESRFHDVGSYLYSYVSETPSDTPTLFFTDEPTIEPSANPSFIPSFSPSVMPSVYPSSQPTGYLGPRFTFETSIVIVGLSVSDMDIELNRLIFINSQVELIKQVTLENYVVVEIISVIDSVNRYLIKNDGRKLNSLPTFQPTSMPTNQGGEIIITTAVTLETSGDDCSTSFEAAIICIETYDTLITNSILSGSFNIILIQKAVQYNSPIIASSRLISSSFTHSEPLAEDVRVPTIEPTFEPTKVYYLPSYTIFIVVLFFILLIICIYNCCFVKSINKQKIFDMMNEEKLEDELKLAAIAEGLDAFDEDDNSSTFQGSQSQTLYSHSHNSQQTGYTYE